MTVQEYEKKIKEIVSEIDLSDIHTSAVFRHHCVPALRKEWHG